MSTDLIARLSEICEGRHRLGRGATLFLRDDPVRSLFIVLDGMVELIRRNTNGSPLVLQRASAGSVLAEASIFSSAYHCDAVAAEDSYLLSVPAPKLRARFHAEPPLMDLWAAYLARQIQQARFRSEVLALRTVAERLDMWLTWHDGQMPPRGRWLTTAKEIGVSCEALYRELSKRSGRRGR